MVSIRVSEVISYENYIMVLEAFSNKIRAKEKEYEGKQT